MQKSDILRLSIFGLNILNQSNNKIEKNVMQ